MRAWSNKEAASSKRVQSYLTYNRSVSAAALRRAAHVPPMTNMPSTPPKTVFVFDNPRTCSQLFNKLMASHPQLSNMLHPFVGPSMYGPENLRQHLEDSEPASTARDNLARVSGLISETYPQVADRLIRQEAALRAEVLSRSPKRPGCRC